LLLAAVAAVAPARAAELAVPPMLWSITAPDEPRVEGATGVVHADGLLYTTSYSPTAGSSSLSIVDASTQELVGSVADPRLDGAAALAVEGDYAYVSGNQNRVALTNANRLTVVDVSDPSSPLVIGSVQDSTALYGAYGVEVVGDLAYVAAQGCVRSVCEDPALGNRLVIVDVSDKSDPQLIGSVADPTERTNHLDSIAVAGNRAYGTAFSSGTLTAFDLTDPAQPRIIGSLRDPLLHDNNDVVVRGRYAYVVDQSPTNARLVIVDIADPAHLAVVGSVLDTTTLGEGYWLQLAGDYAFVAAAGSDALTVVDVHDPTQPEVVASKSDPSALGVADGIDVAGNTAYVAAFCTAPNSGCSHPTTGALSAFDVTPYTALDFSAGPAADDSSNRPSIAFSASQPEAAFTCALDGASPTPCSSPFVPPLPLDRGPHSLTVSTLAGAATWAWTIDVPTISSPAAGSSSSTATPVFKGSAGTHAGDVASVTVTLFGGASPSGPPLQTLSTANNPNSGAYSVTASSPLAPGTYTALASQPKTDGSTASSIPVTFSVVSPPESGPVKSPASTSGIEVPVTEQEALSIRVSAGAYSPRQVALTLACSGRAGVSCRGTVRLVLRSAAHPGRAQGTPVGSASYAIDAGAKRVVRVPLNRTGRAAVSKAAGHRLQVAAKTTLAGGSSQTRFVALAAASH
jgi:hypothetical protein